MATEGDVTGVITETSNDFSVVSISIDGKRRLFSFSKTIFYTFGEQCDGSMTNILEEGTEVELTIDHAGSKPRIVAVWLGDKPEVVEDNVTDATYDQTGRVSKFVDSEWILAEANQKVLINKEDFFRDGERVDNFGGISIGEEIFFDAIPFEEDIYAATCAWIGPIKPRLVDRFNLRSNDEHLEDPEFDLIARNGVNGTVVVIPNDSVAIAEVKTESMVVDVLLFRSSFSSISERICDVTEVGEGLFMRLRWCYIFSGRRQWIAVSAVKTVDEIIADNQTVDSDGERHGSGTEDVGCEPVTEDVICSEPVAEDIVCCEPVTEDVCCEPVTEDVINSEPDTEDVTEPNKREDDGAVDWSSVEVVDAEPNETADDVEASDISEKTFGLLSNVLYSDPPLTGTISRFAFDSGCISYSNLKIFVDRENFYEGGVRSTVERFMETVTPGTNVVNFEALRTFRPDDDKHGFTHDAICAWVGEKPTVSAVAKSMPPAKVLKEKGEIYFGLATKYHLPRFVLVVIPADSATVVIDINAFADGNPIPLHPSNGVPGESLITNYVKLREYVRFEPEINPDLPNVISGCKAFVMKFSYAHWNRIKLGYKLSHTAAPKTEEAQDSGEEESSERAGTKAEPEVPVVFNALPFREKSQHLKSAYLLNCQGILERKDDVMVVEHDLGSIVVNNPLIHSHTGSVNKVDDPYSRVVSFDAVSSPGSNNNFSVQRMWTPGISGTRPPVDCLLLGEINCPASATFVPKLHFGKISSIPLYNCAIATVKGVPVVVPLEALVTFREAADYTAMEELLSMGDDVAVNVVKRDLPGGMTGKFCKAISCWKLDLEGKEFRTIDKIENSEPEIPSWFNVWGFGEYYRKERVTSKNGGYYVEFSSSKRPNLQLCLDLFERNSVYINGLLADGETLKNYVGHEIMFHVAHAHPENLIDFVSDGMFVACAWIGQEPSPEDMLKARVKVPDGLVLDSLYEAIVEDFPLPTHAISLVGAVPVLVPLTKNEQKGKFVGVSEENLKKGDRIRLRVVKKFLGDGSLILEGLFSKPCKQDRNVLRNLTGTVVESPNPTGILKAADSDVMVSFDLCHVRDFGNNDVESVARLGDQIVGNQVRFTAIKVKVKEHSVPFRALEVIVND